MPSIADARDGRLPVRIAHLGLGNFHRAHQAWYTQHAQAAVDAGTADAPGTADAHGADTAGPDTAGPDSAGPDTAGPDSAGPDSAGPDSDGSNTHGPDSAGPDPHGTAGWGIAAFTGRSPRAADALAAQDCVYTLITRAADGDTAEIVQSISEAHDGGGEAWERTLADPAVAILTVTVTERGYEPAGTGAAGDAADPAGGAESAGARIVRGLRARARASAGPIALVSCDNLSANGEALRSAVMRETADDELKEWITRNASFVSTMVDRITPGTTDADRETARALTGFEDAVPVVTEPFSEWVLSGDFPGGRPAWDRVGARFVDDIEPYERRKLWLLNAGHTLLAAVGLGRGHETVAEAFGDAECRVLLEDLWTEARGLLPFDDATTDAFLAALRTRFANPRIAHRLTQIDDGSLQKLKQRQAAIMSARLDAGDEPGRASLATVEAWGRAHGLDLAEALDVLQPGLARRVYLS